MTADLQCTSNDVAAEAANLIFLICWDFCSTRFDCPNFWTFVGTFATTRFFEVWGTQHQP